MAFPLKANRLKILSLNHKPPFPAVDGGTAASASLLRALADAGHRIEVLAYATDKHPALTSLLPKGTRQRFVEEQLSGCKAALRIAGGRLGKPTVPTILHRYRSSRYRNALHTSLHEFAPDVVLIDGLPPAIWLDELAEQRLLYRAHNAESAVLSARATDSSTGQLQKLLATSARSIRLTQRLEGLVISASEAVFAISEEVARYCRALDSTQQPSNGGASRVLHLPVPMAVAPEPTFLPATIFHLGAMDWWPNQQGLGWFLQEVWPRVLEDHRHLVLHLAGRNTESWLAKEGSQGTPTEGIQVDGFVNNASAYMQAYGILIAPVFEGSGVKIKVLEAMAQGRAVLTTDHGAKGLAVKTDRHLLIANTPAGFAQDLCRLLASPALRLRLARAAHALVVEEHHPPTIAQRFLAAVS